MASLTCRLSDFGDPAVILKNPCGPDICRNLRECCWRGSEEHPEVDIVLYVVRLGHLQPGKTGEVLPNGLIEADDSGVIISQVGSGVFFSLEMIILLQEHSWGNFYLREVWQMDGGPVKVKE